MIGRTLSHYKILEKLGEGGMGEVFLAEDTNLERQVALKILPAEMAADPQRLERFAREAKAIAALNHPNIVTIHSVEHVEDIRFLTMERVSGESLDKEIARGASTFGRFIEIAKPLVEAMCAAHEKGITHRDLKPANIMITEDGRVKVLDFGLAKLNEKRRSAEMTDMTTQNVTRDGMVLGTLPYMSPEQVQGRTADARSDIFSLGVIFNELLTGQRPFRGETPADLISSILRDKPRSVTAVNTHLPNHLGRVVRRCLEKDPGDRYQTTRDLSNELKELQREVTEEQEHAHSVAVLPFVNMSPDPDQEYFCEGIAEELINGLGRIEDLRVASRTSAFQFTGKGFDIHEVGRRLNVNTVLEGSVRKSGNRLRITAQLVNVADGYRLWSERYDRTMEDIFAVQDDIAESIVKALEVTLSPKERRAIQNVATRDVEAYDYYLRGRKHFYVFDRENFELARQMYERAIELDPNYAVAYAGIADSCSFLFWYAGGTREDLGKAEEASRKALELDPDLPEAHAARGLALLINQQYEASQEEFETAIRLNPRLFDAYYFYARASFTDGNLEKAAQLYEKAIEVRPEDFQVPLLLPQVYRSLGRIDDAIEMNRRGVEVARRHLQLNPSDTRALSMGASALVEIGEKEEGLRWGEKALSITPDETGLLYNIACLYSQAGDTEKALDCLEGAVRGGYANRAWIENDSDFDPLRDNPRFGAILKYFDER